MILHILRYVGATLIIGTMVTVVTLYYRESYEHAKRLRVVEPDQLYRSGQMTGAGFRDAFTRYNIRTVVNLQEDNVDPEIPQTWQSADTIRESELCEQAGVRYILLRGGEIEIPKGHDYPVVIDEYLDVLDDPDNYPILIHCKAGLHRTGLLTAIYRIKEQGWSKAEAVRELKANGFGNFSATRDNVYLERLILNYNPDQPKPITSARKDDE